MSRWWGSEKHSRAQGDRLRSACTQLLYPTFYTQFFCPVAGHSGRGRILSTQTFRKAEIWILSIQTFGPSAMVNLKEDAICVKMSCLKVCVGYRNFEGVDMRQSVDFERGKMGLQGFNNFEARRLW